MYTIYYHTGEIIRNSDGKIISPTTNSVDLDYLAYLDWIIQGNTPEIGEISETEKISVQLEMWELIKAERDRRKSEGGYKVGTNWYHSDISSRIQQLGLVIMGAGLPANLYWKTMDSSFVLMTQTLALQIFQAAATSDMTIFAVAEQKRAAMLASANPSTYNYLSGWPLVHGE